MIGVIKCHKVVRMEIVERLLIVSGTVYFVKLHDEVAMWRGTLNSRKKEAAILLCRICPGYLMD
jgi:hypothetical protein